MSDENTPADWIDRVLDEPCERCDKPYANACALKICEPVDWRRRSLDQSKLVLQLAAKLMEANDAMLKAADSLRKYHEICERYARVFEALKGATHEFSN